MSLTEEKILASVNVLAIGILEIREDSRILRNGAEIATSVHRYTLSPGDDLTGQPPSVIAIANAVWTPEVIDAWQAYLAQQTGETDASA